MSTATKPKSIRIGRRGDTFWRLLLGPDQIVACDERAVTAALDRRTFARRWLVYSDRCEIHDLFGDVLTIYGPERIGARDAKDGHVLWETTAARTGLRRWQDHAIGRTRREIEIRRPTDGEVIRSIELPWDLDVIRAICGDIAIVQAEVRKLGAVDLRTGDLRWERPLFDEMDPYLKTPMDFEAVGVVAGIDAEQFIVTYGDSTFACRLVDGSILWHARAGVAYYWPNVVGERIHVLRASQFITIEGATGRVVWDIKHEPLNQACFAKTGAAYRNRIAFSHESGELAIFSTDDGSLVSLYEGEAGLWRTIEADGRLVVGTADGTLLVFDESVWGL